VHISDLSDEQIYRSGDPYRRAFVDLGGARTLLAVPLCKDNAFLGVVNIYRQEVRPFSDKQIALLENFAAQAVIAMENARLLTETREALEQQTATAEVLQVINASPGDLTQVFDSILAKAHSLCGADYGSLLTYDGEAFRPVARHGPSAHPAFLMPEGVRPAANNLFGRIVRGEGVVHIQDMAELARDSDDPMTRTLVEIGGIRTQLMVPLRKDNLLLGVITANRQQVRPFSEKQIALLQNFAVQAVIAMDNARLITETREALEQQTATAEVLQVINSSPGDLAPVFDAMLDNATRLCEAVHGTLATYNGEFFRFVAVHGEVRMVEEEQARGLLPPSFGVTWPRLLRGDSVVHVTDVMDTDLYRTGHQGCPMVCGCRRWPHPAYHCVAQRGCPARRIDRLPPRGAPVH
jgi:GAF domain-containing protein